LCTAAVVTWVLTHSLWFVLYCWFACVLHRCAFAASWIVLVAWVPRPLNIDAFATIPFWLPHALPTAHTPRLLRTCRLLRTADSAHTCLLYLRISYHGLPPARTCRAAASPAAATRRLLPRTAHPTHHLFPADAHIHCHSGCRRTGADAGRATCCAACIPHRAIRALPPFTYLEHISQHRAQRRLLSPVCLLACYLPFLYTFRRCLFSPRDTIMPAVPATPSPYWFNGCCCCIAFSVHARTRDVPPGTLPYPLRFLACYYTNHLRRAFSRACPFCGLVCTHIRLRRFSPRLRGTCWFFCAHLPYATCGRVLPPTTCRWTLRLYAPCATAVSFLSTIYTAAFGSRIWFCWVPDALPFATTLRRASYHYRCNLLSGLFAYYIRIGRSFCRCACRTAAFTAYSSLSTAVPPVLALSFRTMVLHTSLRDYIYTFLPSVLPVCHLLRRLHTLYSFSATYTCCTALDLPSASCRMYLTCLATALLPCSICCRVIPTTFSGYFPYTAFYSHAVIVYRLMDVLGRFTSSPTAWWPACCTLLVLLPHACRPTLCFCCVFTRTPLSSPVYTPAHRTWFLLASFCHTRLYAYAVRLQRHCYYCTAWHCCLGLPGSPVPGMVRHLIPRCSTCHRYWMLLHHTLLRLAVPGTSAFLLHFLFSILCGPSLHTLPCLALSLVVASGLQYHHFWPAPFTTRCRVRLPAFVCRFSSAYFL